MRVQRMPNGRTDKQAGMKTNGRTWKVGDCCFSDQSTVSVTSQHNYSSNHVSLFAVPHISRSSFGEVLDKDEVE